MKSLTIQCLDAVHNVFGALALSINERGRRFFEEAAELAQWCGVSRSCMHRIVDRVQSKPVGDLDKELQDVGFTLHTLCGVVGAHPIPATEAGLRGFMSKPASYWHARQMAKHADGVGAPLPEGF